MRLGGRSFFLVAASTARGVRRVNYLGDGWKEGEILKDIAGLAKAS